MKNNPVFGWWSGIFLSKFIALIIIDFYAQLDVNSSSDLITSYSIDLTQFCDPPLTTIAQPRYEIGREAMLLLLDQMQGQHVGSGSRLMDCELIIRGSTRALP